MERGVVQIMSDRDAYIRAFTRVCKQAKRSGFSLNLLTSTPTEQVDERFTVSFGVGGLVTLLVDPNLYEELRGELDPHMRKILRDAPHNGKRKIEFYPT
jgi:hypothetical protein